MPISVYDMLNVSVPLCKLDMTAEPVSLYDILNVSIPECKVPGLGCWGGFADCCCCLDLRYMNMNTATAKTNSNSSLFFCSSDMSIHLYLVQCGLDLQHLCIHIVTNPSRLMHNRFVSLQIGFCIYIHCFLILVLLGNYQLSILL